LIRLSSAAAWLALLLVLWPLAASRSASAPAYYMTLGSRVSSFAVPPVVTQAGRRYIAAAVLDQLHPGPGAAPRDSASPLPLGGRSALLLDETVPLRAAAGGSGMPRIVSQLATPRSGIIIAQSDSTDIPLPGEHYNPEEDRSGLASDEDQPAPSDSAAPQLLSAPAPSSVAPVRSGRKRYQLGAHVLDLPLKGQPLAGELNGNALSSDDLFEWNGARYVSAALLQRLGLVLYFNSLDGCYALCGLVYRVEYNPQQRALALSSLVPLTVTGEQVDEQQLRLDVEGGFFASPKPTDIVGDPFIQRMSFKSQPQLGRGFIYLRQPKRTGYRALADRMNGYARVDLGNYFRLASYDLTSSGEISLNIELGAAAKLSTQQLDGPPRLVLDFAGVSYDDATQRVAINRGAAKELRIGTPQAGTLRVVLELAQQRDYRVLTKDGGARYFVQLLPAPGGAPLHGALGGRGQVVMLDAGHGGSDPGAPGVVDNADEKDITLKVCYLLKVRLEQLGYRVLMTRTDDRFVSLGERGDYANSALPYVFVSIHCNSISQPDYQGAMTFHHDFASSDAVRLARDVQAGLLAATGAVDKGVRKADFFVLRETVMPAILVETGFMTNKQECARLLDPAYQTKLAQGIAAGIDQYCAGR
jgi:N-acetylmuramoyl-L-alanine amidase